MVGPYPGQTYISVPQAGPLTGIEVVPLLQSGRNRWTTASNFVAMISNIAGITQIDTGTGLTGGTITASGTISFAQIKASSILANPTTATGYPQAVTLGTGLSFSGTTIVASGGGGGGSGSVTQVSTGSGLTGGPITSSGTLAVVLGSGLAFSGNQIINVSGTFPVTTVFTRTGDVVAISGDYFSAQVTESGNLYFTSARVNALIPVSSVFSRTGAIVAASGDYSFSQISSALNLGTQVTAYLSFTNIQSASPSTLLGNPTTATSTPSLITLGAGIGFSGTTIVNLSGAADGVQQISTGTGLTGGPVTSSGTILFAQIAPTAFWANVSTATNTPVVTTIAGNLTFSGSTLTTTNLTTGTVGSVATGTGLTGGTITNTGTISFASIAASSLWANVSTATAVPVVTTLGGGLGFSGTTIVNLSGAVDGVSSITFQSGLSGATITSTGTVGISNSAVTAAMISSNAILTANISGNQVTYAKVQQIAPVSLLGNVSTATTTLAEITLGGNLAFSGSTLTTTNLTTGTVGSITFQSGLSGATITNTGTVGISNNGVTNAMIRQGAAFTIIGNPTNATANVQDIGIGGPMTFNGTSLYGFCMNIYTQCGGF